MLWWIFPTIWFLCFLMYLCFFSFFFLSITLFYFVLYLNFYCMHPCSCLTGPFPFPFLLMMQILISPLCSDSLLLLVLLFVPYQNHFSFIGHLILTLFSYNSLNHFTPLLILVHLLFIVGLQIGVIFEGVSLFSELCDFDLAAPSK